MVILKFPDEILNKLINKLNDRPRFSAYLDALIYCAKKDIDQSPLESWWKRKHSRVGSDNFELDFSFFLGRIVVSSITWEEQKAKIQAERDNAKKSRESKESAMPTQIIDDLLRAIEASTDRKKTFVKENPEYRCIDIAERYHEIFNGCYGSQNPLTLIGHYLSRFISCPMSEDTSDNEYVIGFSTSGMFGYEDDRPPLFIINSKSHQHLLALASWVSEKTSNPYSVPVFNWSLNCGTIGLSPPKEVVLAACRCSHGLFSHLMMDREIELNDADSLIGALQLPLAVNPKPAGPAHLSPEFNFVGFIIETDSVNFISGIKYNRIEKLALAWKDFFKKYKRLRNYANGGRAFPYAGDLYRLALASQFWDDLCWYDEQCIEKSFDVLSPDIFCVLDFLRDYFNNDELLISDAEETRQERFLSLDLIMPIVRQLRKESWHELATSILCFYLVASAIAAKGNLDGLKDITAEIVGSQGLPGHRYLTRTIEIICTLAEHAGHEITRLKFNQFRLTPDEKVVALIHGGENEICEFKSTLRINLYTKVPDLKIEHEALKTVAGFLNKRGGSLLIGVEDDGNVIGIDADKFPNPDKFCLHFKNLLSEAISDGVDYVSYKVLPHEGKKLLFVECEKSLKPIFMKNRLNRQEEFYVRRGPSTECLSTREAVEYIQREYREAEYE